MMEFDGMSGSSSSDKTLMQAFRSRRVFSHAFVTCSMYQLAECTKRR